VKGGWIIGDIRGIGVYGSDGCEMIIENGEKWGLLGRFVAE